MHRFLLLLSVLSVLVLVSCKGSAAITVQNSTGRTVGSIDVQGTQATILNTHGDVRGKVRGTIIRDDAGKHIGTVTEGNGRTMIVDTNGNPLGTLEKGTECYGKGQDMLGQITAQVDSSAAAAACLIFFLQ